MHNTIKIPSQSVNGLASKNNLILDGYSIIEQCIQQAEEKGTLFLEEHVLFFILDGTLKLIHGKQTFVLGKNEMILLKKNSSVQFEKKGNQDIYDSLVFSLKDDLLKSFLANVDMEIPKRMNEKAETKVFPMTECLTVFADSIKQYFDGVYDVHPGHLRLKMMEMLYNIAIGSRKMFLQILEFYQPAPIDIHYIMEGNYTSSASLNELARLSGRSLSSFKRDFQSVYNISPAKWIREKRLEKAKELLKTTQLSVSDICFLLGFENISHFSRIFKDFHKNKPSFYKNKA